MGEYDKNDNKTLDIEKFINEENTMSNQKNKVSITDMLNKQTDNNEMTPVAKETIKEIQKENDNINKFVNGNLRKEINKTLSLKITEFQDEIIKKLAQHKRMGLKELIIYLIAEEGKKESIL
jgi:hypothetical protein